MYKFILTVVAVMFYVYAGISIATASDLVYPEPIAGTQFIKIYNDPNGGSVVSVDTDLDGECNTGIIFFLRSRVEGEPLLSIPSRSIPCEVIDSLVRKATEMWDRAGYTPMIYDRDLGELVPFVNPKVN